MFDPCSNFPIIFKSMKGQSSKKELTICELRQMKIKNFFKGIESGFCLKNSIFFMMNRNGH